jgi:uncharacterized protein (DUF58 family)
VTGRVSVPTTRFIALLALGLLPMLVSAGFPPARRAAVGFDVLLVFLGLLDLLLAPRVGRLRVQRRVPPVLSAGVAQEVVLVLGYPGDVAVRGELRDFAPLGFVVDRPRQPFFLARGQPETRVSYRVESPRRGSFEFGDVHVRLTGPLGLWAQQGSIPLAQGVQVFPNLTVLTKDALALAHAAEAWAHRPLRRPGQGSEFESLRPWAPGDDVRHVDWKATARRGQPIVRRHQPEKNQTVLLFLDCGRHMAGQLQGRRKLDLAVDAALRMARVSLEAGDAVGLLAFGPELVARLAPRRGREQLAALTRALYRAEAQLAESDYGRALDIAFRHHSRRTLVVVFTDLLDTETSAGLVRRTLALLPRHLPILVSLLDEELEDAARVPPQTVQGAFERHVAQRLSEEYRLNASRLQSQGARVVRALPEELGAAAVSEYLVVKGRGLL